MNSLITDCDPLDYIPCSFIDGYQPFGETCRLHLQGRRQMEIWVGYTGSVAIG